MNESKLCLFFKLHFIDCAIKVVLMFPPLPPFTQHPLLPQVIPPPLSLSMSHAYKFFGCSISCTILNITLFCAFPLCFLTPAPFLLFSSLSLPANNPPNDLHIYDSVPVLVVCLVCFCFHFLGSVIDNCEFVVILLFIILIIFFLNKSL